MNNSLVKILPTKAVIYPVISLDPPHTHLSVVLGHRLINSDELLGASGSESVRAGPGRG